MDIVQEKKGYKWTEEYGYIPKDWEVKKLNELTTITMGQSPSSNAYNTYGEGLPLIQGNADIDDRKTIIRFYTREITKQASKGDTILTVRAPVGNVSNCVFDCCIGRGVCSLGRINLFLYYFLIFIENLWDKVSTGSTFDSINSNELKLLEIPYPPLSEQQKIASVLSDVDSLIDKTKELINKKKDLKIATMQKLLKPKEGWKEVELGSLLSYEQPTDYIVNNTEYNNNSLIPVLTAGKTFILGYTDEINNVFSNLPVIIFDDFTTESKFVTFPFKVKSSAMKILKPANSNVNIKLVFELMQNIEFHISDHKRYWISEYQYLKVKIPISQKDQNKIATILSDMDSEIESLEKELVKYYDLKSGMMQQLLTGKVRLIK